MGRRSINTTKSGKYMNPTDQARKEARKKELKKNKKQRQMVRAAVLKGKDPAQLIEEMEKIDEMEYNVLQPSPLNEKVLREKRKKLKETFDRVMRLYHNDDPELWTELKRKEVEYERRRSKRVQYFESVRTAQSVQVEDIPLPDLNEKSTTTQSQLSFKSIPNMPADFQPQIAPPSLKQANTVNVNSLAQQKRFPEESSNLIGTKQKESPGVPPFPPIDLLSLHELDSDYESNDSDDANRSVAVKKSRRYSSDKSSSHSDDRNSGSDYEIEVPKPTSVQQRILAIAGQKYDDFMKELENVHKKKEQDRNQAEERQLAAQERRNENDDHNKSDKEVDKDKKQFNKNIDDSNMREKKEEMGNRQLQLQRKENPALLPNISSVPAPPMHNQFNSKLTALPPPPPPPMGIPPSMMFRPPMRPNLQQLGMRMPNMIPRLRMPPGPPPGLPPARLMHPHHNKFHPQQQQQQNMLHQPPKDTKGMTTITAKPQIRNLSADVTRFVPSALRVKREDKKAHKPKSFVSEYNRHQQNEFSQSKGTTKDDAYMQFMREMQGLL